ncbi:MAG TPA: lysophospholipid acyltransferase family protein [Coriobacteriia bacterium]|nr:lysophospholipid acyltransferase family protein [Coriobacteriia bacterium]
MSLAVTRVVRGTLGRALLASFRTRVIGAENVPPTGALLAGNHVSYLDPVLLWCASPRRVHFIAKAELWESRLLGTALDHLLAFPVHRGAADRAALTHASALLASGELVGIFPEGTRHESEDGGLGEASEGVAYLALRAMAPVVPVGIAGTADALPPDARLPRCARVRIVFGTPVSPASFEGGDRRERIRQLTSAVMDAILAARTRAMEA